jgi:hypothetical protein
MRIRIECSDVQHSPKAAIRGSWWPTPALSRSSAFLALEKLDLAKPLPSSRASLVATSEVLALLRDRLISVLVLLYD